MGELEVLGMGMEVRGMAEGASVAAGVLLRVEDEADSSWPLLRPSRRAEAHR